MTFFRKPIDRKGVALFIVLASMATLAIFVGEITYTAQINQKLAYDRLDQVKAQALAKSGLRIGLLRIRAYSELKKTVSKIMDSAGGNAALANSVVPKSMIEKIWSEPITIPFSGDVSSMPMEIRDALLKFRKDSGMEGKLYISIQAQSNKVNLNSTLPTFAALATPTPSNGKPTPTPPPTPPAQNDSANPTPTPIGFNPDQARQSFVQHIKDIFQKKSDEDEKFRDLYRSFRIEDLTEEIFAWSDLSYESPREQNANIRFKKAPFYHISELNYLPSMDDAIYNLLSEQFSAGVASTINVNTIQEAVLRGLIPQMTKEEMTKFFEYRDGKTENPAEDNQFKVADDFFNYLKGKVQYFSGSDSRISDFKNNLTQRGIQIITEESNFLIHIEATVQQTKKTLEAMVSLVDSGGNLPPNTNPNLNPNLKNPQTNTGAPFLVSPTSTSERSNLKITQLRFL